jgi:hypothetical protein
MSHKQTTGISIKVLDWKDGHKDIALYFEDFDQMVTLSPTNAKEMAFLLVQCADFIEPPFGDDVDEN